MPIQYLQNSPVQFYKLRGTNADVFENSAYDQRRIYDCDFITPSFCQEVDIDDALNFQFKASEQGSELISEFFFPIRTANNTSVSTGELIDSGANFSSLGVLASYLVVNNTDNTSSYAIAPIGTTTLTLNDDIFGTTPENYTIYPIRISGVWKYNVLEGKFYIDVPSGSSTITLRNTTYFDSNKWYKVSLTVNDYVGGTLRVKLGSNTIGTITANGNYTFYGTPTGINIFLSFEADADFKGAFSNFSAYQLNQTYLIEIRDLSDNLINSINHFESSNSLSIGNVVITEKWSDYLPEDYCGCYRLWVYDNVGCQLTNVLPNGDFASDSGWTLTGAISITGGQLVFTDARALDAATNYLFCLNDAIVFDGTKSYTVTFTISNRTDGGVYFVLGTTNSATYSLDGTYSFTITPGIAFDSMFSIVATTTITSLSIDNISVTLSSNDIVVDAKSECFHVCDQDNCTIQISWTNNTNAFGYYYDAGFINYMRLNARIRNAKINDLEFNPFKNSIGVMSMPYYNGQKVEELAISPIPEYMHNALAVGLSHRKVTIQDVAYIRTGAYTPDWTDDSELAKVIVEVAKVNQTNLENRY